MTEITIVRHAQASFGTGDYDRLSTLGHTQAQWLGEHFIHRDESFDRVFTGSLRRHRETVQGIATALGLPEPMEDPRLNELDYGALQQKALELRPDLAAATSRADFLEGFPPVMEAWNTGAIAGDFETFDAFEARVLEAVSAIQQSEGRALVVTSGGVIGIILRAVLQLSVSSMADLILNINNSSVHQVSRENGKLRLTLFNNCSHLDRPDRAHARTYI